jgi:hypothetical protein
MKWQAIPNHGEEKAKKVETNIDITVHNQFLQQERQLNDGNHHMPINTNTEC